jgi:antitoxin (DNA-binding transcriptional repressor) of toxin-antitoxin stability system
VTTLDVRKAKAPLAEYARNLSRGPVVLTRDGRPVAALVSMENVDPETLALSSNRSFLRLVKRSRAAIRTRGGLAPAELRRKLGLDR